MPDEHLDQGTLERAMRGEEDLKEVIREMLRHLLAICPQCREAWWQATLPRAGRVPAEPGAAGEPGSYGPAFERVLGAARELAPDLRAEKEAAPGLVAELQKLPEGRQAAALESPRFQTWGVCDLLINESHEAAFDDPQAAESLARLALELAARLDPRRYGAGFLEDVKALAWAYLGNARRVGSNLAGAEEALEMAGRLLERGVGEPLTRAQVLNLEASLRRDQRRFEESQALLDRVIAIYRTVGDRHMEGRTLVKKASGHGQEGHAEQAVALLRTAIRLIDPSRDTRLVLCARHNLAYYLVDAGRCREAQEILEKNRHLYGRFEDFWTRLRLRWLEGKVAACLERFDEAEAAFRETRQGFINHGVGYDAALVSLELAALYAAAGRTAEVKRLAQEMLPVFRSRDIHREALAALLAFQQAALAERLTVEMAHDIAAYLRRARRSPHLRYGEPS